MNVADHSVQALLGLEKLQRLSQIPHGLLASGQHFFIPLFQPIQLLQPVYSSDQTQD